MRRSPWHPVRGWTSRSAWRRETRRRPVSDRARRRTTPTSLDTAGFMTLALGDARRELLSHPRQPPPEAPPPAIALEAPAQERSQRPAVPSVGVEKLRRDHADGGPESAVRRHGGVTLLGEHGGGLEQHAAMKLPGILHERLKVGDLRVVAGHGVGSPPDGGELEHAQLAKALDPLAPKVNPPEIFRVDGQVELPVLSPGPALVDELLAVEPRGRRQDR